MQFYISVGLDPIWQCPNFIESLCHTRKHIYYITENTSGIPLDENDTRIFGIKGGNFQIVRAVQITNLAVTYSVGEKG